ncbi:MAG: metallophosphoesterase [Oscillospiraceae bacterium]|nr:metallophosphoesterase [Oscillospiraceae bacterium]
MKKLKIKRRYIILTAVIAVICVFLLLASTHELTVTYYEIGTDKLNAPVRIALLTDLHSSFYGKDQAELISAIDEQHPDIVVMAGDIADDRRSRDGTIALLAGIEGKYPSFFVTGNHEVRGGKAGEIKELFRGYGVVVLEGESRAVEINGQFLNIAGADDSIRRTEKHKEQLKKAFGEIDENLFTVFLFHRPERFLEMTEYGFDLKLTGHIHGGQWGVPFTDKGVYAPNQGLFPKYTHGLHISGDKKMIISRGLALNSPPIIPRLFNPPELVIIDLVPLADSDD